MTDKDFSFIEFEGIPAALEAGKQIAAGDQINIAGIPALRFPENYTLKMFPELMPTPQRVRFMMQAANVAGFCDYIRQFGTGKTAIFHSITEPKLIGIVDFHGPEGPEWCEHVASLEMTDSEQWTAWSEMKSPPLGQVEFAEFIEQHADEVSSPPVAGLLEAVLNFRQTTQVTFSSVKQLQSGLTQLVYNEEDKSKQVAQLPSKIVLGIPVFEGGAVYAIEALLRYRARDGALRLWFEISQEAKVRRQAVQDVVDAVKRGLSGIEGGNVFPFYAGSPLIRTDKS